MSPAPLAPTTPTAEAASLPGSLPLVAEGEATETCGFGPPRRRPSSARHASAARPPSSSLASRPRTSWGARDPGLPSPRPREWAREIDVKLEAASPERPAPPQETEALAWSPGGIDAKIAEPQEAADPGADDDDDGEGDSGGRDASFPSGDHDDPEERDDDKDYDHAELKLNEEPQESGLDDLDLVEDDTVGVTRQAEEIPSAACEEGDEEGSVADPYGAYVEEEHVPDDEDGQTLLSGRDKEDEVMGAKSARLEAVQQDDLGDEPREVFSARAEARVGLEVVESPSEAKEASDSPQLSPKLGEDWEGADIEVLNRKTLTDTLGYETTVANLDVHVQEKQRELLDLEESFAREFGTLNIE
jgi:hypothetical protein